MGAAIFFMRLTFQQSGGFHSFKQRSYGVWIAAHQSAQLRLADALRIAFGEGSQGGELVRGDAGVQDPPPERLIQPVPGMTKQKR